MYTHVLIMSSGRIYQMSLIMSSPALSDTPWTIWARGGDREGGGSSIHKRSKKTIDFFPIKPGN